VQSKMKMLKLWRCRFPCKMMDGANSGRPVMRWAAAGELPRRQLQLGALGALEAHEVLLRSHEAQSVHEAQERASNVNNAMLLILLRSAHTSIPAAPAPLQTISEV
jgi:hypothetical protein